MNRTHKPVLPRLAGRAIERALEVSPAVVVTGARQTGKSTLVRELAALAGQGTAGARDVLFDRPIADWASSLDGGRSEDWERGPHPESRNREATESCRGRAEHRRKAAARLRRAMA